MSDDNTNTLDDLAAAAESAVAELEALKPPAWIPDDAIRGTSAPWTDEQRQAEEATEALRAAAVATLFPDRIVPIGSDLWADFERYAATALGSGERLARIHGNALDGHGELAAVMRTANVLERVRGELRSFVPPRPGESAPLLDPSSASVSAFIGGVAAQLVGNVEFEPAASILAETVPGLHSRLATAVKRLETDSEARARSELSAWFQEHIVAGPVQIGRERFTGSEAAGRIDEGDEEFIDLARHYWLHHPAGGGQTTRGRAIFA